MLVSRVVKHLDPEIVAKGGAGLTGDGDNHGRDSGYSSEHCPDRRLVHEAHYGCRLGRSRNCVRPRRPDRPIQLDETRATIRNSGTSACRGLHQWGRAARIHLPFDNQRYQRSSAAQCSSSNGCYAERASAESARSERRERRRDRSLHSRRRREAPLNPMPVDDVLRHLSTSLIDGVDDPRPVSDTGPILTVSRHERRSKWAPSRHTNRRTAVAIACGIASPITHKRTSAASAPNATRRSSSTWSSCRRPEVHTSTQRSRE